MQKYINKTGIMNPKKEGLMGRFRLFRSLLVFILVFTIFTSLVNAFTLSGTVTSDSGVVSGASMKLYKSGDLTVTYKTTVTDSSGKFIVSDVVAGSYELHTSFGGLATKRETIVVSTDLVKDVVLSKVTSGKIEGIVRDKNGPVSGAVVTSASLGSVTTGADGKYSFTAALGSYQFTVTKSGYVSKSVIPTLNSDLLTLDILIEAVKKGTIEINVKDASGALLVGANVLVTADDFSQSCTTLANGKCSISVPILKIYDVKASKSGYTDKSRLAAVNSEGEVNSITLLLSSVGGALICSQYPGVTDFVVNHILGSPSKMSIEPKGPSCANVIGYRISRNGEIVSPLTKVGSAFIDTELQYEQTYEYSVVAVYDDGELSNSVENIITTGSQLCEGRNVNFCNEFTLGMSCNSANVPVELFDCSDLNNDASNNYQCTGPNKNGQLECKDIGVCGVYGQDAFPFGLFYSKSTCEAGNNYCYFDTSSTVVDKCYACTSEQTCYDYNSKSACETDRCSAGISGCSWYDYGSELDTGFCYPKTKVSGESRCDLCADGSCNADACSKLGACFTTSGGSCTDCADSVCSDFTNQQSCTGGKSFDIVGGKYVSSSNSCSVYSCKWSADAGCFKDGNDNDVPDCRVELGDKSFSSVCEHDLVAPKTLIKSPVGFNSVSSISSVVEFTTDATDLSGMKGGLSLYYCVDKTNGCVPSFGVPYSSANIAIVDLSAHISKSGIYYLRYYSTDKFFNQEELRVVPFYADVEGPQIVVDYSISGVTGSGASIRSNLRVDVSLNEKATCTGVLFDLLNGADIDPNPDALKGDVFRPIFNGLKDGDYIYSISCIDGAGNVASLNKEITVDSYKNIQVLSPLKYVSSPDINFKIKTLEKSSCDLEFDSGRIKLDTVNDIDHLLNVTLQSVTKDYSIKARCIGDSGIEDGSVVNFVVDLDYPVVDVLTIVDKNTSNAYATISCTDVGSGCDNSSFKYGIGVEGLCFANRVYSGGVLVLDESEFCYSVSDYSGLIVNGSELIYVSTRLHGNSTVTVGCRNVPIEQLDENECPSYFTDSDNDGVVDALDKCDGSTGAVDSDGCSLDSDEDGMPDSWEKFYGLNPSSASDKFEDLDNDGVTNYDEYLAGTDPSLVPSQTIDVVSETPVVETSGFGFLSWFFLILGILMVLGGAGYLVYKKYYVTPSFNGISTSASYNRPNIVTSTAPSVPRTPEQISRFRKVISPSVDRSKPFVTQSVDKPPKDVYESLRNLSDRKQTAFDSLKNLGGSGKLSDMLSSKKESSSDVLSKLSKLGKKKGDRK